MIFAYSDQQRMHFVKVARGIPSCRDIEAWVAAVCITSFVVAKRPFHEHPNIFVCGVLIDQAVSQEYAARIGVDHEYGNVSRVQQNGIRGFASDSGELQKFCTKPVYRGRAAAMARKHSAKRAAMVAVQVPNEGLKAAGFLAKESGGAYELFESGRGKGTNALQVQFAGPPEAAKRVHHVAPGGILGQVGSDDDLKRVSGGPPALRAIMSFERPIELVDFLVIVRHIVSTGRQRCENKMFSDRAP